LKMRGVAFYDRAAI